MACGPKKYRAREESCLRRARTVRNPILAEEVSSPNRGCASRRLQNEASRQFDVSLRASTKALMLTSFALAL